MAEYIEREAAFDAVFGQFCASSDETEQALNAAIEEIKMIPAADVVPVVRCKDCKYRHDDGFCGGRGWPAQLVPDDGYCDRGARMDGDGK